MLMYQIVFSITFYLVSLAPDIKTFSSPGLAQGDFPFSILALTLYDLAAVIMVVIALAGIARLLHHQDSEKASDDDSEPDWPLQPDDYDNEQNQEEEGYEQYDDSAEDEP